MRTLVAIVLVALFCWSPHPTLSQSLSDYDRSMAKSEQNAMVVLGSWAAGNILTSGLLMGRQAGSQRYFHQMNIGWNLVNLGIAASGWIGAGRQISQDEIKIYRRHERMRRLLLFNAGLDLGYMAAGAWMLERSINEPEMGPMFRGFGRSLVLQGGFLFLFDLGAFLYLEHRHRQFEWRCTPTQNGLGLEFKF